MSPGDLRNLELARAAALRGLAACDRADALLERLRALLTPAVRS